MEEELFGGDLIHDYLYGLFLELSGQRFFPALSLAKFVRISKVVRELGGKLLNKVDLEVCYKRILEYHEQMDFYAFIDAAEYIVDMVFPGEEHTLKSKLTKLVDKFKSMSKPLFYF